MPCKTGRVPGVHCTLGSGRPTRVSACTVLTVNYTRRCVDASASHGTGAIDRCVGSVLDTGASTRATGCPLPGMDVYPSFGRSVVCSWYWRCRRTLQRPADDVVVGVRDRWESEQLYPAADPGSSREGFTRQLAHSVRVVASTVGADNRSLLAAFQTVGRAGVGGCQILLDNRLRSRLTCVTTRHATMWRHA